MDTTLYIKNMVCDRCKAAVAVILTEVGLRPLSVELGVVHVCGTADDSQKKRLRSLLSSQGFTLLDDRREQTVERVKSAVIEMVHYGGGSKATNLSDYLSERLNADYSALSRLFSEFTGQTIEHYFIMQRIERVKELLQYGELTLGQIAMQMNYSSTAYLSTQFKNATGMTPSQYKAQTVNCRKQLDRV